MGQEIVARSTDAIAVILGRLAAARCSVLMVDQQLHAPNMPVPDGWRDLRLRTPAGMVTLRRQPPDGIAVVVFGNADAALVAMQQEIARAISAPEGGQGETR